MITSSLLPPGMQADRDEFRDGTLTVEDVCTILKFPTAGEHARRNAAFGAQLLEADRAATANEQRIKQLDEKVLCIDIDLHALSEKMRGMLKLKATYMAELALRLEKTSG